MAAVLILSVFLVVCWAVAKIINSYRYYSPSKFPPGPTKLPLIGNLLRFKKNPLTAMMQWKKEYGPIVGCRLGDFRTVILNDYDLIKEAFSMEAFNGRPEFKPAMMFTGGNEHGTLTSVGNPWDVIRRFTIKNLNALGFGRKSMEGFLQQDISTMVNKLKANEGKAVDLNGSFYIPAVNHLFYILTGIEIPEEKKQYFHETIANLNKALWLPIGSSIWLLPWMTSLFPNFTGLTSLKEKLPIFKSLITDRIAAHRTQLKEEDVDASTAPSHLVDAFLKEISKAEVDPSSHFHGGQGSAHMEGMNLNLFVTAAEAMNNTMNWTLLYLSLYPEVQEKLAQEISTVLGGAPPTMDDLKELPYTKAVMQEVLRIATTSPFSNFQATTTDVEFHGYFIPKGTMIIANLYGLHHDEGLWSGAEEFRPERFLQDDGKQLPPLIPFSVGLRTCLGQTFAKNEMFMMLVNLVQEFRWEWPEGVEKPSADDITEASRVSIFRFCPKFKVVPTVRRVMAMP